MSPLVVHKSKSFKPYICLIFLITLQQFSVTSVDSRNNDRQTNVLTRWSSDPELDRNSSIQRHSYHASVRDSCKNNYRFDYVQLSLMWPPGFCSTSPQQCKREQNDHFTVHGMWPTLSGTREPADCCFNNTFDYRALEPIMPILNDYWYSYYETNDNSRFWSHEWLKHGTCSRDVPNLKGEVNYFGTTVRLAKNMRILDTLKRANIVPDNARRYQASDIVNALNPISNGKVIQIECDFEHHQPIPVLKGLNFCFDADLKPSDCPQMRRKCQRQVIFPTTATSLTH